MLDSLLGLAKLLSEPHPEIEQLGQAALNSLKLIPGELRQIRKLLEDVVDHLIAIEEKLK